MLRRRMHSRKHRSPNLRPCCWKSTLKSQWNCRPSAIQACKAGLTKPGAQPKDLRPVRRKPDPQAGHLLFKVIAARTSPSGAAVALMAVE
jgi:hypothetical protein